MNHVMKCAVAVLGLGLTFGAPTAAYAKKGWMSCLIVDDTNKNGFYSEVPFIADDSVKDKAYVQYIVDLLSEKDHILSSAGNARGRCNWDKSRKDELFYVGGFLEHFQGLGYTMHADRHMPDPYAP